MENLLKQDQVNFEIFDPLSCVLQVVLLPNQSIFTELDYIKYCSGGLSFREVPIPFLKKLTNSFIGSRYRAKNRKGGLEYIGLSKSQGKILAINPSVLEDSFFTAKHLILAYSSGIKLQYASEPTPSLKRLTWLEIKGNGLIFLQGSGSLIEKRLGIDEEIHINKNDIIAFSKSIKLSESLAIRKFHSYMTKDWSLIKVKGPGFVYIQGSSLSKESNPIRSRRKEFFFSLLIFSVIFSLVLLDIIFKD